MTGRHRADAHTSDPQPRVSLNRGWEWAHRRERRWITTVTGQLVAAFATPGEATSRALQARKPGGMC